MDSKKFYDKFWRVMPKPNFRKPTTPVKIQTRRQVSANRIETMLYNVQDIILTPDGVLLIRTTLDLGILGND